MHCLQKLQHFAIYYIKIPDVPSQPEIPFWILNSSKPLQWKVISANNLPIVIPTDGEADGRNYSDSCCGAFGDLFCVLLCGSIAETGRKSGYVFLFQAEGRQERAGRRG